MELAGAIGVEPWRLTLRQLLKMHRAKMSQAWDHTAALMALIHNVNTTKKTHLKTAAEFHPLRKKPSIDAELSPTESIKVLTDLLVKKEN